MIATLHSLMLLSPLVDLDGATETRKKSPAHRATTPIGI